MLERIVEGLGLVLLVLVTGAAGAAWAADPLAQAVGGVVSPARKALLSFPREGAIISLAPEGSVARKGQALGQLDSRHPAAMVATAEIGVQAAEAQLKEILHDLSVHERLLKEELISREQYRNLEFQAEYARIRLDEARTKLGKTRLELADCTLLAPFPGVVSRKEANVGEMAARGKAVLELSDTSSLELSTDIPLDMTANLGPGATTSIMDGGKVVGTATLKEMLPLLDPSSGLRRVIWTVQPGVEVLAGRYVTLAPWDR
ncbi:MAG: efflux RND transporter periplasmic adaptor subunit [Thermodesulfobacteriota bacterium]